MPLANSQPSGDPRSQMTDSAERFLKASGYSVNRDQPLLALKGKAVGWSPCLYATKASDRDLAIEVSLNGEMPGHVLDTLRLCGDQLHGMNLDVIVLVPAEIALTESLARASMEFALRVCTISQVGFSDVLSKETAKLLLKAEPESARIFREERKNGRHIPTILLDLARQTHNIKLRNELITFADEYQKQNFAKNNDPLRAEYEFIFGFLSVMLARVVTTKQVKRLDILQRVEKARIQFGSEFGNYRDHFIHSFQVFLTGLVVLDSQFQKFKEWVHKDVFKHLEETWILIALYHDVMRYLEETEWLGEQEGVEIGAWFLKWQDIIQIIVDNYEKVGQDRGIPNVAQKSIELKEILKTHYTGNNHGVLAALDLINSVSPLAVTDIPLHVAHAAFCMAVHDKGVWGDLEAHGIMPLQVEQNPLAYLLVCCDSVQEWGRPANLGTENVGLLGLSVGDTIECAVFFEDPSLAALKLNEFVAIKRHLKSAQLPWTFSIRVGLGQ